MADDWIQINECCAIGVGIARALPSAKFSSKNDGMHS